jgi:phosphoglycerate dehydrogenase-like enzyme
MQNEFLVGLGRDLLTPEGEPAFDPAAFAVLEAEPTIRFEFMPDPGAEITAEHAARYDGLVVARSRAGVPAFSGRDRRLKILARFGVGYDAIDLAAATRAGVIITNTPDGVRRPVATIILTFVLALSHKLLIKDRLVRSGRWNDRTLFMGVGLTGKTVGIIGGMGNIGRDAFRLLRPLDLRMLAADPTGTPEGAAALGVTLVDLETLLREADFVVISVPLSPATRRLIGARELGLMEPTPAGNPILELDNVIVTPHALCWTDECFRLIASSAFQSIVAVARGDTPTYVVNREVLGR